MQTTATSDTGNRKPEHATNGHAPDEFATTSARLRSEFDATLAALRRVLYVERKALELSLFDFALRVGMFIGLGVVGLAMAVAAGLLAVSSLRHGFAILFQGAWWSDLALALVVSATLVITALAVRRGVHRSALARTRLRLLEEHPASPAAEPAP